MFARRAALLFILIFAPAVCTAQTVVTTASAEAPSLKPTPTPVPGTDPTPAPLTERERAMLEQIRELQERVSKLEVRASDAGRARTADGAVAKASDGGTTDAAENQLSPVEAAAETSPPPAAASAKSTGQDDERKGAGTYTPNLGFKLADTKYGDLSVSIYTYVRYLNQLGLNPNYVDAFGNAKSVQRRQDMQLLKLQIKFLGWIMNPKLRYFLYAWTSNANQGQGAQVVLAGNLQYTFSKYFTLGGGIRSLPGTRSVEGNFPFWPSVDSRMIADEFMRPSYTSGVWATGELAKRLKYTAMLGNNMSTLGVPASRLDNGFNTFSGALVWYPTGDYEKNFSDQGWGDFEHHDKFSTRFGLHFSRSDENKESQPGSDVFENTQLRLSDGTVIFTPNLFSDGVTITDARWRMISTDGALKYRGYSLEGEYYWRALDKFKFPTGIAPSQLGQIPSKIYDHGFQLQGSAMLVPKTLQLYAGHSRIFGKYGNPYDFRVGTNFFPFKNKVVRWNTEALYIHKSPVGYTSVPFAVGGTGWVFHTNMELAF